MGGQDDKFDVLFQEAVQSQERLKREALGDLEQETGLPEDEEEILVEEEIPEPEDGPAEDQEQLKQSGFAGEVDEDIEPAIPPKRSASEAVTEALIEAKQEAVEALEKTREETKRLHERLLRVTADFENFRKRTRKEQEKSAKFATESLLRDLLPVLDNFERALEHGLDDEAVKPFVEGVGMVHGLLLSTLEKVGLQGFSAVGKAFDPNHHEAVEQTFDPGFEPGAVAREYQMGYLLHDRLLRPAMVAVAMPPPTAPADAASNEKEQIPDDDESSPPAAAEGEEGIADAVSATGDADGGPAAGELAGEEEQPTIEGDASGLSPDSEHN